MVWISGDEMVLRNAFLVGNRNDLNTAAPNACVQSFRGNEIAYLREQKPLEKKIWDGSRIKGSMSVAEKPIGVFVSGSTLIGEPHCWDVEVSVAYALTTSTSHKASVMRRESSILHLSFSITYIYGRYPE